MNDSELFLSCRRIAVAGASVDRAKYGNIILQALVSHGYDAIPLNPKEEFVEELRAYRALPDIPEAPEGVSIVTPPSVTRLIVEDAIRCGVKAIWMQPGAEHREAADKAREAGLTVIDDGSCILVALSVRK